MTKNIIEIIFAFFIIFQEIDVAVSAMKMTAEREEVIDFIAPYYEQTGISIGRQIKIPAEQI